MSTRLLAARASAKGRNRSSLCDEASSLNGMVSRTHQRVAAISAIFCGHLALGNSFRQTQMKTDETLVYLWATMLRATSKKSRFPGDTGPRGASPTGVSHALAPAFWAMALYGAPSTSPMFCLDVVLQARFVEPFFLHFRLASLGYCSGGALLALLQPVVRYTLELFRSSLGWFLRRCWPGR